MSFFIQSVLIKLVLFASTFTYHFINVVLLNYLLVVFKIKLSKNYKNAGKTNKIINTDDIVPTPSNNPTFEIEF